MPRCMHEDVLEILQTTMNTEPFIVAANLVITQHLGTAGLSAELLKELERWLSAHFCCIRDPRYMSLRDGETSVTAQRGPAGLGLDATSYGQQVALLDPTGLLVQAMSGKRAYIRVE